MKNNNFKIDLLIDMANIFSEFMLNYSQKISKKALTNYEAFKLYRSYFSGFSGYFFDSPAGFGFRRGN